MPEQIRSKGTRDKCSFCLKSFNGALPSQKNVHYVFRVRTKFITYYGPTHNGCVDRLRDIQIPGTATEAF